MIWERKSREDVEKYFSVLLLCFAVMWRMLINHDRKEQNHKPLFEWADNQKDTPVVILPVDTTEDVPSIDPFVRFVLFVNVDLFIGVVRNEIS